MIPLLYAFVSALTIPPCDPAALRRSAAEWLAESERTDVRLPGYATRAGQVAHALAAAADAPHYPLEHATYDALELQVDALTWKGHHLDQKSGLPRATVPDTCTGPPPR